MIYRYVDREFATADGITSFKSEIEYTVNKNNQKIKECQEMINKSLENLERKIKTETKNAARML